MTKKPLVSETYCGYLFLNNTLFQLWKQWRILQDNGKRVKNTFSGRGKKNSLQKASKIEYNPN